LNNDIQRAISILKAGGVIAYPTEAVYGLGCDPHQVAAVERILAIKQRPVEKGLILVASDKSQLLEFLDIDSVPKEVWRNVLSSWPGPYTWLLPVRAEVSELLRGRHSTLAVRVSDHPIVKQICSAFGGAIVSTSANRAGQAPAKTADETAVQLGDQIDMILVGDTGGAARPSEIRDALTGKVIRAAEVIEEA